MSDPSDIHEEWVPPERLAEASVWVARLNNGEQHKASLEGVKQWLKAHPLNSKALGLCAEMWEESAQLRRIMPFADEAMPAPRRTQRGYFAAAALVLLAICVASWLWPMADLATGLGEQRSVTLKDGTHVFLNTSTRLSVHYTAGERVVRLDRGEALFEVAKRPDWPFIVLAGDQRIRALGTTLIVRRDAAAMAVTLVEGRITVSAARAAASLPSDPSAAPSVAKEFTLTPGQRLTFAQGRAHLDITSIEKATAWRRGQVVFDDTPLSEAVAEMNRYSPTKLNVARPEARAILVTGLFQTDNSASFARAVAQTYGLKVEEREDEIDVLGIPMAPAAKSP